MGDSISRTLAAVVALLAVAVANPSAQQGGPTQAAVTATAVIRGRVAAIAGGAPIRGAEVRAANGRDNRLVTTDEQGRFEIPDLAASDWTLKVSKAGFVTQQYGQRHPLEAPSKITLANGQRFTADVSLMRGGAIVGRVYDHFGEPVAGARLQVLRSRLVRGQRQLVAAGTTDQTDDRGAFRAYGLVPGDYYVAATLREQDSGPGNAVGDVQTYYPGTSRIRDAQRIRLGAGEEAAITIVASPPMPGGRLSGVVLTAAGNPASGASIHLYDADDLTMGTASKGTFVVADPFGRFTIDDVVPGSYVVDAVAENHAGIVGMERALVPVEVGGGDVSGMAISTTKGATLVANVVAAPGTALPPNLQIGVSAQTAGSSRMTRIESSVRASANRIQMPGLFGRLVLNVTDLPKGWMLSAIEINGHDVAESEVDLTGLGTTVSARIVLTNRMAEVSGTVAVRGEPREATVVVFPDDKTKWTYPSRFVRMARSDREGRFSISELPAANRYRAVAVSFVEEDAIYDPEFLEGLKGSSIDFGLIEGQRKAIELTAIAR